MHIMNYLEDLRVLKMQQLILRILKKIYFKQYNNTKIIYLEIFMQMNYYKIVLFLQTHKDLKKIHCYYPI